MKDTTTGRFTIRVDEETELVIRHEYELFRQGRLVEGKRILSLNEFLIGLMKEGLELEWIYRRDREAFLRNIASEPKEEAMNDY